MLLIRKYRTWEERRAAQKERVARTNAVSSWKRSMKRRERSARQGWWASPLKLIQRYCGVDYGA